MALQQQYTDEPGMLSEPLRLVVRRLRRLRWVRCASFGALVGVCVSLTAVVLAHFYLLPDWFMLEAFIPVVIALGVGIGTVVAYAKPIPLMQAARLAEMRLGLKERLSSALEFESYGRNPRDPVPSVLMQLQQRDAAAYARAVRPKEAVPFRMPWQLKALIAATVVLILAIVLPNLPMFNSPEMRLERAIVARAGDKLEKSSRIIEHRADIHQLPQTKWAAQQMRRLGQQMARGHMDKRQALVKYGRLTQQMKDLQKQMAGTGQGGKSLTSAGQQLAKSLQSPGNQANGQAGSNPQSNSGGQGKGGNAGASAKGDGKAGDKANGKDQHGFNIPALNNNGKPGANGQQNGTSGHSATSEIQRAAQALQQADVKSLSQQLRQLAQRVQSGQMSKQDLQQAQQDLKKLSDALRGSPLKETQQHAQGAADAMKDGDNARAADEMRKAADAAERETRGQQDQNAMRDAQNSLQNSRQEMAGASSSGDINQSQSGGSGQSGQSGQGQGSGQGDSSGQDGGQGQGDSQAAEKEMARQGQGSGEGRGDGNPGGDEPGEEGGGSGAGNRAGHGNRGHAGKGRKQKFEKFQGPPGRPNPNFDPSKFPRYAKIYLGKPGAGSAAGRLGATIKTRPGSGPRHPVSSSVPYYDYVGGAKRAAEHAVDNEDIPPAYKDSIHKYFDSLTPTR